MAKRDEFLLPAAASIVAIVALVFIFNSMSITGAVQIPEIAREGNQVCIFTDEGIVCTETGTGRGTTFGIPREVREGNMPCYLDVDTQRLVCEGVDYQAQVASPQIGDRLICWYDEFGQIVCS